MINLDDAKLIMKRGIAYLIREENYWVLAFKPSEVIAVQLREHSGLWKVSMFLKTQIPFEAVCSSREKAIELHSQIVDSTLANET